jgi:RNase P subunit RPR2
MPNKKEPIASSFPGRLKKTVFCPECDTMMRYAGMKAHQSARDARHRLIKVTRVFYWCPKCYTVVSFSYREDGNKGDLYKFLQECKNSGIRPGDMGDRYISLA